jgi:hypothetical protein
MQQKPTVIGILIFFLVSVIYFSMYNHRWFVELFSPIFPIIKRGKSEAGGNILFVILLFYIYVMRLLVLPENKNISWIKIDSNAKLFLLLLVYFISGVSLVIMHEESFDAIKRYLIYLFAPMMVFLSIWGLYRKNENIKITLHILFMLGIIFSLYSVALHIMLWGGSADDIANISAMFGSRDYDRAYAERFTIPGMPVNMLQSALVPLILTGFYFNRNSYGWLRYFYTGAAFFIFFGILITASRGAFISLSAGMLYLAYKRWLKFNKGTLFAVFIFSVILFAAGDLIFQRIAKTNAVLEKALAEGLTDEVGRSETRLASLIDSFTSYIIANPISGSGFSYFVASQDERLYGLGEHNFYVRLLAQGGLLLFIPFMFILAFLYFNSSKILSRNIFASPSAKDIGILLNAGLIAYIVDLNFPPGFFYYYWIWFGFAAAWARNCEMECRLQSNTL